MSSDFLGLSLFALTWILATRYSEIRMVQHLQICSRLEHVFDVRNHCVNRLIIPIVKDVHFFVFVVDFN